MKRFLDDVGSDAIGFYFDPGNMAVFQFPQHWARITGPHIKMVHLKDWTGNALNGSWPPLLQGKVDFAAINRELRAAGYDGPMISEVPIATASLKDTAAAIRKIIAM
jgi:hexulose-6-phosphate isomerase